MKIICAMLTVVCAAVALADPPEGDPCTYRLDPRPVAKTPAFLGLNVEVMQYAERANIWDWLADSGAGMVRLPHPDTDLRKPNEHAAAMFRAIKTKDEFEACRARLCADPAKHVALTRYRFNEEVAWLGTLDLIVPKLKALGAVPLFSLGYAPGWFERPLVTQGEAGTIADDMIDWGAAASAYDYAFTCIWHFASRFGVTRYMMLNEPPGDAQTVRQIGVLARLERLALEDVRKALADTHVAAALTLSSPAAYMYGETFWPHVEPHTDFFDVHLYEPDASVFARKLSRALATARLSGKRAMLTEFNRVGGPMPPEDSLFAIGTSLEVAGLLAAALTTARPDDPGLEAALLYEFQFPATHRNFKSLVYGDMNWVDWSGQDRPARRRGAPEPTFDALQLRFATPAYAMFRMMARCVPSGKQRDVFEMGEANLGVSAVRDPLLRRNLYGAVEPERYYAHGGGGSQVRTFAVRADERLIVMALNPEPVSVRALGFDVALLGETFATAVVRETSALRHDETVAQLAVSNGVARFDLAPKSLTQLIFVKEDLSKMEELRIAEETFTPGNSNALGTLETTRLKARGRIGTAWFDLSGVNVAWTSSNRDAVRVGQCGLVQRFCSDNSKPVTITARAPNGITARHTIGEK